MLRIHTPGRIVVIGVGGGGNNTVNYLMEHPVSGVACVNANTDVHGLNQSLAPKNIQLGQSGLGANGQPRRARLASWQSGPALRSAMEGADVIIVTAGLGGGTGTGAAPEIFRIAKILGLLTVGVVTLPFAFEGSRRENTAKVSLAELQQCADALICFPNELLAEDLSLDDAFNCNFESIRSAIRSFAESSPWSESLQQQTRKAMKKLPITLDGVMHFKHATLGFAYAYLSDLLLLQAKNGHNTFTFASVDALLWAGWVLD